LPASCASPGNSTGENNSTDSSCLKLCECSQNESDPNTPILPCAKLPKEFVECKVEDFSDLPDEEYGGLSEQQKKEGCREYGANMGSSPSTGIAKCTVLEGIHCFGQKEFTLDNYPCIKYGGYRFPTALLLSVFLGWLGIDRLYLGHCGLGVLKLLSLGGIGIWWFVDLVLLSIGTYYPYDGFAWEDFF
jgi:hypothetical protein